MSERGISFLHFRQADKMVENIKVVKHDRKPRGTKRLILEALIDMRSKY